MTPAWHALVTADGDFNPTVYDAARGASGAYAIRRAKDHAVLYVGDSTRGNLWKTLLRHFQAPASFRKVRNRGVFASSPIGYEVALWVTSHGARPRAASKKASKARKGGRRVNTFADQQASEAQATWIATLKPSINLDDGRADPEWAELRAHAAKQQAEDRGFRDLLGNPRAPPPNVSADRRDESRTPDLWTGRTRGDEGARARRDWKGDAERLAVDLAECRRAPPVFVVPPSPVVAAPIVRPEGYGEADERGQARMFNPRPENLPELRPIDLAVDVSPTIAIVRGSRTKYQNAIVRGNYRRDPRAALVRWDGAGYESTDEKEMSAWLVKALKALHVERTSYNRPSGRVFLLPGVTEPESAHAVFWLRMVSIMPPVALPLAARPWTSREDRHGTDGFFAEVLRYEGGHTPTVIALAADTRIASLVALLAELTDYAVLLKALGRKRTASEAYERADKQDGDPIWRKRWIVLAGWMRAAGIDAPGAWARAIEGGATAPVPVPATRNRAPMFSVGDRISGPFTGAAIVTALSWSDYGTPEYRVFTSRGVREAVNEDQSLAMAARTPDELLRAVDAGKAHALTFGADVTHLDAWPHAVGNNELAAVRVLEGRGSVREMEKRGRWPRRLVVTSAGSHALGTFASDDENFRFDARAAGAAERDRRAELARIASGAKPAGYGVEETRGKKAGQLRLLNPGKPRGALQELGVLTCLDGDGRPWSWGLRSAPVLAYDVAGRLFIVYGRRVVAASSKLQRDEYKRIHWGKAGRGELAGGGVAPGPFRDRGPCSAITYTTKKGTDAAPVDYVHAFEGERPRIVEHVCRGGCAATCAARGALALHGGSYRLEKRGIVG